MKKTLGYDDVQHLRKLINNNTHKKKICKGLLNEFIVIDKSPKNLFGIILKSTVNQFIIVHLSY